MPQISRRSAELGTENAFVVLAEVTDLIRKGNDIISFCVGQPDFPTPANVQEAGIKAIRDGKARVLRLRRGSRSSVRRPRDKWERSADWTSVRRMW